MKKTVFSILALAALVFAPACNEIDGPVNNGGQNVENHEFGTLSVAVKAVDTPATKADVGQLNGDLAVSSLQVLAYNGADGKLARDFGRAENPTASASGYSATASDLPAAAAPGKAYKVFAIANHDNVNTYMNFSAGTPNLLGAALDLKDVFPKANNAPDFSKGIMRMGSADANVVTNATNSASVTAEIPAFRAVLRGVTVNLYDNTATLSVVGVMMENVTSLWNYGMTGNAGTFVNLAGRKAGSSTSTNASDFIKAQNDIPADYRALLWRDLSMQTTAGAVANTNLALPLYGFPNATTTDSFSGPVAATGAAKTRVVLVAQYNNEYCYYPLTIDGPQAGKTYDISLTIRNKGSEDPNKEPEYGSMNVTITVNGWADGGTPISGEF